MDLAASAIRGVAPPRLPLASRQSVDELVTWKQRRIYMPSLQKGFMISALLHEGRCTPAQIRNAVSQWVGSGAEDYKVVMRALNCPMS